MKSTHATFITQLPLGELSNIISDYLGKAKISDLQGNSLSGSSDVGILAEWNPLMGFNAAMQVLVDDLGESRRVTLIALGNSLGEGVILGMAKESAVRLRESEKMLRKLSDGIRAADPQLRDA